MKFCSRPYKHLYIGINGNARCCSWARFPLGNVAQDGIEKVWNGEKAQEIRASIEDGSFRYCDEISCPLLSNNQLPDLNEEEINQTIKTLAGQYPKEFNLAYDLVCNHACPTCRNEIYSPSKEYKETIEQIDKDIVPFLNQAELIMASGSGDFFASPSMMRLISKVTPIDKKCIIKLETNGSLVEKNWSSLKHLEDYNIRVVVTPNSYEKESYEVLSGGIDNLDKTLSGIKFLSNLREKNQIKELKITMVYQDTNFREIPSFIQKSIEKFNVDLVQIRPVMKWFNISKEYYLQKNILNPLHPNHEEFMKIIQDPICSHPKVYHWCGDKLETEAVSLDELDNL